MSRLRTAAIVTMTGVGLLAATTVFAGPASAHVSVSSTDATQGGYGVVNFRVPTEEADASTVKLQVQLPDGIAYAATQPLAGWTAVETKAKLAKPVQSDDGPITEGVSRITWTASAGAGVKPGQFQQFVVQLGPLPEQDSITFKAIQTYSNGKVVSWIQTPAPGSSEEPDFPAPTLQLAAASGDHHGGGSSASSSEGAYQSDLTVTADDHDEPSNTGPIVLSIIAVVLAAGALGLSIVNRARARS
ncbi:YcnI family copper-binding membrane protein [Jatrophihabitans fulvus]